MAYAIVRADPNGDRDAIFSVWSRNRPQFSTQRYEWIYGGSAAHRVAVWLLRGHDDPAVGASALLSRRMRGPAGTIEVGQAIDLVVDPAHRSVGPAILL